jgi:hypothetical protein
MCWAIGPRESQCEGRPVQIIPTTNYQDSITKAKDIIKKYLEKLP